ncbi:MAG: glycosyltransferase family 4 protein [Pseudomonadota bacterium]
MAEPQIVVVSTNAGQAMGGEAIKAYQFFIELNKVAERVTLVTHERCRDQLAHLQETHDIRLIEDDWIMVCLWRSRILRFLVSPYFHMQVRRLVPSIAASGSILHYLCPISPVANRLPPRGYKLILGPLNGNITYPSGFSAREGMKARLRQRAQVVVQKVLGKLWPEKKRFDTILVSGFERTRASLRAAGCPPDQMVDVCDSGLTDDTVIEPRMTHTGRNTRFICSGRFIDYKGIDLAIRAIARANPDVTLDVFGDGEMGGAWKALSEELGLTDRVSFHGWCPHEELLERMRTYRGYLFPTLAEANGIVMQEAMMIGLPVVTLKWGGPEGLADESSAVLIEPKDEDWVVARIAEAIDHLSDDATFANELAQNARRIAEERFPWSKVLPTWTECYGLSEGHLKKVIT